MEAGDTRHSHDCDEVKGDYDDGGERDKDGANEREVANVRENEYKKCRESNSDDNLKGLVGVWGNSGGGYHSTIPL